MSAGATFPLWTRTLPDRTETSMDREKLTALLRDAEEHHGEREPTAT